ncbi:MAG: Cna B-type domain-containing protein, partial [Pygmaiobacter sp.]
LRPTSITINLIRTDSDNNETQISKTVTAADNWTAVFENVDLYDSDGKLYTNVFTEEAVPGYATDYLVKDEGLKVEITNTLSAKANVVATKTWLDAGDESMRPEALPLTLYRQTGTSEKTVVTTEPTITKTGSNWSYNYGELAQYDTEGRPYVYSVEETVPAGYTLDTARSSVLHLYNVRTELTNVTATKAWQDSDNADGIRPQSVELSLERGIAPQAMTPLADTKVTVTAQANWQHTYENLPKFDENGNLYLYNVKEETMVPHYDEVAKAAPSTTATNQIRNKHLVTVRYVDLGTETKLMGDVVLGSFYEGQDYSAATQAAQPIQTYTNLGVRTTGAGSAPINGTMGTEDLLIVIEYSKIRTIPLTVKYMEVTLKDDGSFDRAAAIPMVGVNDVTTYFAEGESYDANRNPGLTYGYSFVKSEDASVAGSEVLDPTNLTGTMSPEKPLTFIHYFVRKLGENVIMHSYNHIHHPLTGNDVVNAEGQNSNPLNAGGTISIASLLVTVNGNYSYNPTSAEVLRLKNPQTNDELAALIATTIGDRVSEATKTEKADLDAKMLAVQTAADAQIAAQSAYDAAKLAYDTALATLVAQDPAVVAATQELAKANALIVGVPEADKMALVAAAEATLKSAQDALANAAEDVDRGPLQAAVDAASQALADAAALVIGDATAEVKAAAILAAQTALDSATAAATTTAVANLAAEQAALTAAEQALDAAKTAKVT